MTVNIITIGMAGSGKTTFMQRLNAHLHAKKEPPYVINLDPAVLKVPFATNIDIRDAVNYKKVMEKYSLGPNGAIMTSLNLFATKIDQVMGILEKRADSVERVIIDTPGQIECFIWSASGAIITDALASSFPTVIAYIVDTPRCSSPETFISNMLYACSILYKTKLPMIVVFNKTDLKDSKFAEEWMSDFDKFQSDMSGPEHEQTYMHSLVNSLSLMLEEFYKHLDCIPVSAYTGKGFDEFLTAVDKKVKEYEEDYKAEREEIIKKRKDAAAAEKAQNLTALLSDMGIEKATATKKPADKEEVDVVSDIESDENDGLIDPEDDLELEVDEDA